MLHASSRPLTPSRTSSRLRTPPRASQLAHRNGHLIAEAGKLIGTMLADGSKGLVAQVYAASQKECVVAYKNALMKRIFIHESSKKFIDRCRKDGQVRARRH